MVEDQLTSHVIGAAFAIHKALGPGLLESAYRNCLYHKLRRDGIPVEMEKTLPLYYEGVRTKKGYRVDLLVDNKVVIEVKAARIIHPVDFAQVRTYLKLTRCSVGLILNFGVEWMKNGIVRIPNPAASSS